MKSSVGKQLVLILAVALGVRLLAGWAWQTRLDDRFGFGDSATYWVLGQAVAAGKPYRYGDAKVFRVPGYPILLAPIFLVAGDDASVMWARAQSAAFGTLSVAGVYWLGRRLFDGRVARTAAWIAALYPGAVATSALVLSESPFCPLMLAHLLLWIGAWRAKSPGRTAILAVAGGFVAGAAVLVRPSWLLFVPFAVVVGLVACHSRARQIAVGAAMLSGIAVVMAPWWIRNFRAVGRFVPTTLQVGASLYDGLNPHATGASNMALADAISLDEYRRSERADRAGGVPFEYRLDRRLRAESIAWARAHPGRVLQLAVVKLGRMWNFWPNERAFSRWYVGMPLLLTYTPILLLGMFGAGRTIGWGFPYMLCWLPAVYFSLLHMVFVSSIRYRQPAMLTWIVLAAAALLIQSRHQRGRVEGRPEER